MEKSKFEIYRQKLNEIRSSLIGDVAKNFKTTKNREGSPNADINDEAVETYNRQLMSNLSEQDWGQYRLVEEALGRIESGEYGVCLECGQPIPEARLEVIPFAKYCVKCLDAIEKESKVANQNFDN